MKTIRGTGILLVLAVMMISCGPAPVETRWESVKEAVAAPELGGLWYGVAFDEHGSGGSASYLHVVPDRNRRVDLVLVDSKGPGANVLMFKGYATKIAGSKYLCLRFVLEAGGKDRLAREYWVVKYELSKAGVLSLSYLGRTFYESNLKNRWPKKTWNAEKVLAFLKSDGAKQTFVKTGRFLRIDPEAGMAAALKKMRSAETKEKSE